MYKTSIYKRSKRCRKLPERVMTEAGLEVHEDEAGNIISILKERIESSMCYDGISL